MLELTKEEQKQVRETLVKYGCLPDESIADELVRITMQDEKERYYHSTKDFLELVRKCRPMAVLAKQEGVEEEYAYVIKTVDRYEKAMLVLSKMKEYELNVRILKATYGTERKPAKEIYQSLNMGKTCYFKYLQTSIQLFSIALWGSHIKKMQMAFELMEGG